MAAARTEEIVVTAQVPVPDGATLLALLDSSSDGLILLGEDQRILHLNAGAARLLRIRIDESIGLLPDEVGLARPVTASGQASRRTLTLPGPGRARRVEQSEHTDGDRTFLSIRDITEQWNRESRLSAFASTASNIATSRTLAEVLDQASRAVVDATGAAASTVVVADPKTNAITQVGGAGGYPDDYGELLEACRRRGAPLVSMAALTEGRAVVRPDWGRRILEDERWQPVHAFHQGRNWGTLAAVPLRTAAGAIGAVTVFYLRGHDPSEEDLSFLTTISEQVVVAVRNHELLSRLRHQAAFHERQRLARELHDSVSQQLFSIDLLARSLELAHERLHGEDELTARLTDLRQMTARVLKEMRALIFQLRPRSLHQDGLVLAVRRIAAAIAQKERLELEFDCRYSVIPLSEESEHEIFRVVQEAIHNTVKHARARTLRVRFAVDDPERRTLSFSISDDGRGFDPSAEFPHSLGLQSMRERIAELGGALQIDGTGQGTVVSGFVPDAITGTPA
jgi:signal transduction histidine kinase